MNNKCRPTSTNGRTGDVVCHELTKRGGYVRERVVELEVLVEQETTDDSRIGQVVSVDRLGSRCVEFIIIRRLFVSKIEKIYKSIYSKNLMN